MIFHASEMGRVVPCPGSKQIQEAYPKPDKGDGDEGTVAHGIAASVLREEHELSSSLNQSINNILVTQEMLWFIEVYLDECGVGGQIEQPMTMQTSDGHTLTGTPDHWAYDDTTLIINDFKYGHGVIEVFEGWQLLSYATLIFDQFPEIRINCKTARLTVIQPRANHPDGPVRSWEFDAALMGGYRNRIAAAMCAAAAAAPQCITGPHCRYCPGLLNCHSARAAAGYALDYAGVMSHGPFLPYDMALELELVERAVAMLTQRKTALEEEALAMTKRGSLVPGWEVTQSMSALAWTVDAIAIGAAMGVNLKKPDAPITPTQAIQRKLLPKATVEAIAVRSAGSPKLKRVDNARAKRILG